MKLSIFASGSSGNCLFVSSGETRLLIDAGISLRRITASLRARGTDFSRLTGILITHAHADHIAALNMISKYHPVPVFATPGTAQGITDTVPTASGHIHTFQPGTAFQIGDIDVSSFLTPHDAAESVGYRLFASGKSLSVATDLGFVPQSVFDAVCGSDTVVLESNHDVDMLSGGRYPYYLKKRITDGTGHLSNFQTASALIENMHPGLRRVWLCHLSEENNRPEVARKTVEAQLNSAGTAMASDFQLQVLRRKEPTGPFEI